jgi:CheY-like chemotaxis protein
VKLLIVDDEPMMRRLVARAVARAGIEAELTEAGDGAEALARLYRQRFDAVISDVRMPRLDGRALLSRLRADPAHAALPVIMITADRTPALLRELMALGANACLAKPFTAEALRQALQSVLDRAPSRS